MNLPNKLTLTRILLVPFFVWFMLWTDFRYSSLLALIIFAVASITDMLDGRIARKRNQITTFGKFLDPIADKILVLSAMICMVPSGLCSPVVVVIVVTREFLISSLRLVASSQSIILAAGASGKLKTASQMISIVAVLVLLTVTALWETTIPVETISNCLMWCTAGLTVYSGAEYLLKNRKLISQTA